MSKKSYVYMITEHLTDEHSGVTNNYKIGFSASPDKRIGDLRSGNCRSMDFKHKSEVKSEQAAKDAEKEIHAELDKYRIKNRKLAGTEWFYVDGNHFKGFEDTYIKIANKYKADSLSHLDEVTFRAFSMDEADKENKKAIEEYSLAQ